MKEGRTRKGRVKERTGEDGGEGGTGEKMGVRRMGKTGDRRREG